MHRMFIESHKFDTIIEEHNHSVLRLPALVVTGMQLRNVCSELKYYVSSNITTVDMMMSDLLGIS